MPGPDITVVDVYELATEIGREFEKIIDAYGAEAVEQMMPKVINSLELLESFASQEDVDSSEVMYLKSRVAQLESDKYERAENRLKFEKELEQIEEQLQHENKDLLGYIGRLQEENRRLSSSLAANDSPPPSPCCTHEQTLKAHVAQLQEKLRKQEKNVQQRIVELEEAREQTEQQMEKNKELKRKQRSTQVQMRTMLEEKAELQVDVQNKQQEIHVLLEKLGEAKKTNEVLSRSQNEENSPKHQTITYDRDDPDRPRFTLKELRKILLERNELKVRVSELEDELALYRPTHDTSSTSLNPDDEFPVQGPINRDPDDAPWKKQDSGIRKLFRVLFGDSERTRRQPDRRGHIRVYYSRGPEPRPLPH